MSRTHELFETLTQPGQHYAVNTARPKAPVTGHPTDFHVDSSLRRVLLNVDHYAQYPQRVSGMTSLFLNCAQIAQRRDTTNGALWSFVTTALSGMMQKVEQELALAGHVLDVAVSSLPSPSVQAAVLRIWQEAPNGADGRAAVAELLETWEATLNAVADSPENARYAAHFAAYADAMATFREGLVSRLRKGPDAVVAAYNGANALAVSVYDEDEDSVLTESAGLLQKVPVCPLSESIPDDLNNGLSYETSSDEVHKALMWTMVAQPGYVWCGNLVDAFNALDSLAEYFEEMGRRAPRGRIAVDYEEFDNGARNRVIRALRELSSDCAGAVLDNLTQPLQDAGLWTEEYAPNGNGVSSRWADLLLVDIDSSDVADNLLYGMAQEGADTVITTYRSIASALNELSDDVERFRVYDDLPDAAMRDITEGLYAAQREVHAALDAAEQAFRMANVLDEPLPTTDARRSR